MTDRPDHKHDWQAVRVADHDRPVMWICDCGERRTEDPSPEPEPGEQQAVPLLEPEAREVLLNVLVPRVGELVTATATALVDSGVPPEEELVRELVRSVMADALDAALT